jgi:hypothetical protein
MPPPPKPDFRDDRSLRSTKLFSQTVPVGRKLAGDILEAKRVFIAEFAKRAIIGDACRAAGVARATYSAWRDIDPLFLQAVEAARETAHDIMEREGHRRAFEGTDVPAINKDGIVISPLDGKQVFIRQYSDFLAERYLRANRPEKWGTKLEVRHIDVGRATDGDILLQLSKQGVHLRTAGTTIEGRVAKEADEVADQRDVAPDNPYLEGAAWYDEVPTEEDYYSDAPAAPSALLPPPPVYVSQLPPPPLPAVPAPPEGEEGIDW